MVVQLLFDESRLTARRHRLVSAVCLLDVNRKVWNFVYIIGGSLSCNWVSFYLDILGARLSLCLQYMDLSVQEI